MNRSIAFLAVAAFVAAGNLTAGATATVSPDRLRSVGPTVKPEQIQPDRSQPLKPKINPDLLKVRCPRHFQKPVIAANGAYYCHFVFTPKCGPREQINVDSRRVLRSSVYWAGTVVIAEYYCIGKPVAAPEAKAPPPSRTPGAIPASRPTVQPHGGKLRKARPLIERGMSASSCATHFDRYQGRFSRIFGPACAFRFTPVCGPGKTGKVQLKRFSGNSYFVTYNCEPQRR